ncbi:MAG TPA: zinc ribbon domain-containing protein [Longimicrobiaceae bacterium]|nr:zinc ribbon domain-containing protein [Longimicrobiaceae bacterium]
MPTYEYRCPSCGTNFEKFQKMSDEPGAPCPQCGAAAERRMSGGAGLLFKGSGFYITDYARGDSYKKAAESDKGAAAPKSDSASGGSASGGSTSSGSSSGSSSTPASGGSSSSSSSSSGSSAGGGE